MNITDRLFKSGLRNDARWRSMDGEIFITGTLI